MRLIGDTTEPFRSGEVVLIPPGIPHCWYFDGRETDADGHIQNITFAFSDDFLARCAEAFPELRAEVEWLQGVREAIRLGERQARRVAGLLESMHGQDAVERVATAIRLLHALPHMDGGLVVGRNKATDKRQERLDMVRVYVVCNASRSISLDEVSRYVGMNRSAFCSFFKQATGQPFISYLNQFRIEQACQLLLHEHLLVSEVCYRVGFTDVPHFTRLFKRFKGCSPTRFRAGGG